MRGGIHRGQQLDLAGTDGDTRRSQSGNFGLQMLATDQCSSSRLRHHRRHAQGGRVIQPHQRATRQRHIAQRHRNLADHPRIGGLHHIKARLRHGGACLRLQRLHLGLACLQLRLCTVEGCLADVLLLVELFLALKLFAGHLHVGAGSIDLGCASSSVLRRRPCIDTHKILPRLNFFAHSHMERNDGPLHLGREGGVTYGLHHAIHAGLRGRIPGTYLMNFQWRAFCGPCARQGQRGVHKRSSGETKLQHPVLHPRDRVVSIFLLFN